MTFGNTDIRTLAEIKAEEMAREGKLSARDRARLERRYSVRLPVAERRETRANNIVEPVDDDRPVRRQDLPPEAFRA